MARDASEMGDGRRIVRLWRTVDSDQVHWRPIMAADPAPWPSTPAVEISCIFWYVACTCVCVHVCIYVCMLMYGCLCALAPWLWSQRLLAWGCARLPTGLTLSLSRTLSHTHIGTARPNFYSRVSTVCVWRSCSSAGHLPSRTRVACAGIWKCMCE
jgi:hypothetical protein